MQTVLALRPRYSVVAVKPRHWAVLAVGVGFLLRLWAYLSPADLNDEGVYFSAAALIVRGELPYRDFVLLHPPGLPLLASPFGLIPDISTGFVLARLLGPLLGALNVWLVFLVGSKALSEHKGVVAAWLYATFPIVVASEAGLLHEPLLVTLALLAVLHLNHTWAGVLVGAAVLVKLTAGLLLLPILVFSKNRIRLGAVAVATFALVAIPFLLLSEGDAFEQIVTVQAERPPAGTQGFVDRTYEFTGLGWFDLIPDRLELIPVAGVILLGLIGACLLRFSQLGFWCLLTLLAIPSFFLSPGGPGRYAVLIAPGLALIAATFTPPRLGTMLLIPVLVLSVTFFAPTEGTNASLERFEDEPCIYTEKAAVGLLADRLPVRHKAKRLVDNSGTGLLYIIRGDDEQLFYRDALSACPVVLPRYPLNEHRRWSEVTKGWFLEHFEPLGGGVWQLAR